MAESEDFRHWETERRDVKRAEVRLNHGLRSLEEARLSYLNSITKEKRRLQQELQRLQKSHSKQKLFLGTGSIGINMALPLLSHQTRWDNISRDVARRTMRKTLPKPTNPSSSHSHSSNVPGCEDEKGHLPPLKTKDQIAVVDSEVNALKNTIAKQLSISAESMEGEEPDSGQEQGKGLTTKEVTDAGVKGPTIKLVNPPWKRRPSLAHERLILDPDAYGADGRLRTMYSRPDFLKSYADARKFRYIRHKNIPAWEKELSLEEIFGHKIRTNQSPQTQAVMNPKP
ncbi:coiled-coil domain-containing protein 190 [Eublepharis macularius]|uniref:Coiled-coil domain-containing protein 190 n=1 Tax=Eublepharis macularius TaxID=481883 RepID=A0AA97JFT6_EUBMA|nr:coiled-coil domain-containing protein 190 [Eublepharis macularius]XP_054837895.1 coiled-coil domain-containing protein 190 [Eublepharis macularius]